MHKISIPARRVVYANHEIREASLHARNHSVYNFFTRRYMDFFACADAPVLETCRIWWRESGNTRYRLIKRVKNRSYK